MSDQIEDHFMFPFQKMSRAASISLFAWYLVGCGPVPSGAASTAEIVVEMSRDEIYEGESIRYRVTLNHAENPSLPQLEGFENDFEVQPAGETNLNSRQTIIVNGRVRKTERFGRSYDFLLTPKRAGTLIIPAPVAEVDGQLLRGRTRTLEVIAPQDQDTVVLEVRSDRDTVYPMQSFTVTLHVLVKSLPAQFSNRNPVKLLRNLRPPVSLPALSIPWVVDVGLPTGLVPDKPVRRWLESFQSPEGSGFSINNIGDNSVSFFFDRGPMAFMPQPRHVVRPDSTGVDADYWEFEFPRAFTPHQMGTISLGPVSLKGTFITEVKARDNVKRGQIFVVAQPLVVTVKDVPAAGRPESFIGAIGQFTVASHLVPSQAKVGDPMTLTITLQGSGALELAKAPDLTKIAEVVDRFRVYEATEETQRGQRRFTYSIRPLQAGPTTFPPVSLSYFDVEQEKYVTLQTEPIPLAVSEAEQLASDDIAIAAVGISHRDTIEARQDGMLANMNDAGVVVDQSVNAPQWFLFFSCMAGSYVVVVMVSDRLRRFFSNQALQRRRVAPSVARQRLDDARADLQAGELRGAADAVGGALIGLVADVAGIEEAGLTSVEVKQQLNNMGVEQDIVERMSQLLEACDGVRFGASDNALQGLDNDARSLLDDLIKVLKRKKIF